MAEIRPWAVINATGYVRVDEAEGDETVCFEINTRGAQRLASACARNEAALLCFSSDLVFDGHQQLPYVESDDLSPLNVYGRSKAAMEKRVLVRPCYRVLGTEKCQILPSFEAALDRYADEVSF